MIAMEMVMGVEMEIQAMETALEMDWKTNKVFLSSNLCGIS